MLVLELPSYNSRQLETVSFVHVIVEWALLLTSHGGAERALWEYWGCMILLLHNRSESVFGKWKELFEGF